MSLKFHVLFKIPLYDTSNNQPLNGVDILSFKSPWGGIRIEWWYEKSNLSDDHYKAHDSTSQKCNILHNK